MSKHEAKISRTTYLFRMFFAVLISFGLGLGVGFFFSNRTQQEASKPEVKAADSTQKENSAPEKQAEPQKPKELNAEEQLNIVNSALKAYYGVDLNKYTSLKTESVNESKTANKTQDSVFKEKLYAAYGQVLTKSELAAMKTFIDGGTLKTNYYVEFFDTMKQIQIKKSEVVEYKEDSIKAKASVSNLYEYGTTYKYLSSTDFVNKFKGKGITTAQYIKMINLKPSKISVIQTKDVNVLIEKIDDKWLISDYTVSIASSEIKEVVIKGKTMSFSDFAKTYLPK